VLNGVEGWKGKGRSGGTGGPAQREELVPQWCAPKQSRRELLASAELPPVTWEPR